MSKHRLKALVNIVLITVNEGFEEVYEDQDDERDCPLYFDQEVSAIFREAIDPKLKSRNYSLEKTDEIRKVT